MYSKLYCIFYLILIYFVSRMDRVRNEEERRRDGIERGLASRADQSVEMVWACGKNG